MDKNTILPFINFAQELTDEYDWSENSERDLRQRLRKIKNKQLDDKLNLSVVGEFSIGKSSFISSLIRRELLESAALQGTTVASTILDYSPILSLVVNYKNGSHHRFEFSDEEYLREYIKRYSSESDHAVNVDSLYVTFPSDNLHRAKVRIIDTPGTNSLEAWHEETTVNAINELSDASIVLVDATRPLPESQKDFIRENLGDVIEQCAFIVTKIDLLRPRERERMLDYVRGIIEYEFGVEKPFVASYSSLLITKFVIGGEEPSARDSELIETILNNEKLLFEFIAEKKSIAQTKKITRLLEDMYDEISERMPLLEDEYTREHEVLERTKNTDLTLFISNQVNIRASQFYSSARPYQRKIIDDVYTPIYKYKMRIIGILDSLNSKNEIKEFANNSFKALCQSYGCEILAKTEENCRPVERFVAEQLGIFREEFTAQYKRLGLLPMQGERAKIRLKHVGADTINISSADALLDAVSGKNKKFFEKLALISPAKMKAELKEAMQEPMNDYFAKIAQMYEENVRKYISDLSVSVGKEITRYYRRYNSFVAEKISEDEERKRELERKLARIKRDMRRIDSARAQLRELRTG